MRKKISLESMPQAIEDIMEKIELLIDKVDMLYEAQQKMDPDEMIGIDEAAELVGLEKCTIYTRAQAGTIPCYKPGKKLLFRRKELIEWMETGQRRSLYLSTKELKENMQKGQRRKPRSNWGIDL